MRVAKVKRLFLSLFFCLVFVMPTMARDFWKDGDGFYFVANNSDFMLKYNKSGSKYEVYFQFRVGCNDYKYMRYGDFKGVGRIVNNRMEVITPKGSKFTLTISKDPKGEFPDDMLIRIDGSVSNQEKIIWSTEVYTGNGGEIWNNQSYCNKEVNKMNKKFKNILDTSQVLQSWVGD